jgi:hypothetical protein
MNERACSCLISQQIGTSTKHTLMYESLGEYGHAITDWTISNVKVNVAWCHLSLLLVVEEGLAATDTAWVY